jgi:hypothetical protein
MCKRGTDIYMCVCVCINTLQVACALAPGILIGLDHFIRRYRIIDIHDTYMYR